MLDLLLYIWIFCRTRQKRSNPRWSLIKTEKSRKKKRKTAKEKRENEEKKKREKDEGRLVQRKVAEKEERIQRESITEYRAPVSLHSSGLPFIRSIY